MLYVYVQNYLLSSFQTQKISSELPIMSINFFLLRATSSQQRQQHGPRCSVMVNGEL